MMNPIQVASLENIKKEVVSLNLFNWFWEFIK